MEKLVYVLWRPSAVEPADFRDQLIDKLAGELRAHDARGLAINVADELVAHAAKARITQLDPPPAATVSLWLDSADERGPCEDAMRRLSDPLVGYLVVESVPLRNTTRPAAAGEPTPGVNMVTCIEKPERIGYDDWIAHWHGHHRKVALETQCTFLYIRNVVVRALTEGAPPWLGIVEEGFPSDAVIDPMLWYRAEGSRERMKANLERMMDSCKRFLDFDRIESHPMTQYVLD